ARNRAALAGALRRGARDLDPTHGRPSAADGGAEGPTSLRTRRAQLCAATAAVAVAVATLSRARRSAPAGSVLSRVAFVSAVAIEHCPSKNAPSWTTRLGVEMLPCTRLAARSSSR